MEKEEITSKEEKKHIKIGPKILTESACELILPNYQDIYKDIEDIRSMSQTRESNLEDHNPNTKIKNEARNFISIFGKRGAGKTSILYTIERELEKKQQYKSDYKMDILKPELMETDNLMGWLIGKFYKEVKAIQESYKNMSYEKKKKMDKIMNNINKRNENFNECSKRKPSKCPVKSYFDKWVRAYIKRQREYKEIFENKYSSDTEYKKNFIDYLDSDVKLHDTFHEFIDNFIKYKKVETDGNPLIFLLFDDLDLIPYNSIKLLENIMFYLNHPNIIVFISGDYENFKQRIWLNYLRKDDILDKSLYTEKFTKSTERSLKKEREHLAIDYLNKLFPPIYKYELESLTNEGKMKFNPGVSHKEKDNLKPFSKLLEEYRAILSDKKHDLILNSIYYNIFDNKPRGLINVYKFLSESEKNKEHLKNNIGKEKFYKKLIHIILNSNNIFHDIKEELILSLKFKEGKLDLYVDLARYSRVLKNKENSTKLSSYILLVFLEKFVKIKNKNFSEELTKNIFHIMNKTVKSRLGNFEFFNYNLLELEKGIKLYVKILNENNLNYFKIFKIINGTKQNTNRNAVSFLEKAIDEDYYWVKSYLENLLMELSSNFKKTKFSNARDIISNNPLTNLEKELFGLKEELSFNLENAPITIEDFFQFDLYEAIKDEDQDMFKIDKLRSRQYSYKDLLEIYSFRINLINNDRTARVNVNTDIPILNKLLNYEKMIILERKASGFNKEDIRMQLNDEMNKIVDKINNKLIGKIKSKIKYADKILKGGIDYLKNAKMNNLYPKAKLEKLEKLETNYNFRSIIDNTLKPDYNEVNKTKGSKLEGKKEWYKFSKKAYENKVHFLERLLRGFKDLKKEIKTKYKIKKITPINDLLQEYIKLIKKEVEKLKRNEDILFRHLDNILKLEKKKNEINIFESITTIDYKRILAKLVKKSIENSNTSYKIEDPFLEILKAINIIQDIDRKIREKNNKILIDNIKGMLKESEIRDSNYLSSSLKDLLNKISEGISLKEYNKELTFIEREIEKRGTKTILYSINDLMNPVVDLDENLNKNRLEKYTKSLGKIQRSLKYLDKDRRKVISIEETNIKEKLKSSRKIGLIINSIEQNSFKN